MEQLARQHSEVHLQQAGHGVNVSRHLRKVVMSALFVIVDFADDGRLGRDTGDTVNAADQIVLNKSCTVGKNTRN